MIDAYLGVGTNLGNRLEMIRGAMATLRALPSTRVISVSSVYETEAVVLPGAVPQPPYLNAAIHVQTSLAPDGLLHACQDAEKSFGRDRSAGGRWEARTLDIDILHVPGVRMTGSELTLPHPRLHERAFVLVPLAEIAPELHIPAPIDSSVEYLLSHLTDAHTVTRLPVDEPL